MGAWGSGSFQNDDASDWIADFGDDPDESLIVDALSAVVEMNDYLEAPDCSVAIAAAEIVAALKGSPNPAMPEEVRESMGILGMDADRDKVVLALKALERIKTDSELKELWDDAANPAEWYGAISDLETRLASVH
ncbi:MAG: hypothetical protein JWQ98_1565 [Chlorobi bacterium]|nr:hypothetical protein [Chlorobiota bacterium]